LTDLSDAELVQQAQEGKMEAAGELYDRHNQPIFRYVWSRVGDAQLAEDLTGEVFTRMVVHLPNYRTTGIPFRAWLYRVAHNLIVDHHRREGSRVVVSLENATGLQSPESNPDGLVEERLALSRIRQALHRLDPAQREVVILRFWMGLPLREVAAMLDKSVAAVKGLQYRGLIALRVLLAESGERERA
jgi:RNA polymerase sigma-70 factor (ECF subfamily)